MAAAGPRGILANCRLATAISAPSASSQARVNGEKNAATLLADVWWIDQAKDATMLQTNKIVSLGRMPTRFQLTAAKMKRVGYKT